MIALAEEHGLERALGEVYAGHDCWERRLARGATGISTYDVFNEHGIDLLKASIDKASGGRAVRRALHVRDGQPGVVLVKTLHNQLAYDQLAEILPDPKDVNKPLKVDADSEGRGGDDFADDVEHVIADDPFGTYMLAALATGLAAYAVWCWVRARYEDVRASTAELLALHGLEGRAQGDILARVATQFEVRARRRCHWTPGSRKAEWTRSGSRRSTPGTAWTDSPRTCTGRGRPAAGPGREWGVRGGVPGGPGGRASRAPRRPACGA